MAMRSRILGLLIAATFAGSAGAAGIGGAPEAVRAANRLIERVGGDVWATSRSFTARERIYLGSGEIGELTVRRDLAETTRWITVQAETLTFEAVIGQDFGWRGRDGEVRPYSDAELDAERRGLEQSRYYVYHRLASGDPGLGVEWQASERRLDVFEDGDRLPCRFFLDAEGAPISWANIYDGRENRHNYGPLVDPGEASFPKWGAAADGSWRFEYLEA